MPTYDYKCGACKHRFELFQSMSDGLKRKCPKCGKNSLERLIGTGAAVIFKGSGFYQTDYRSDSYKKAAEADKPPEVKPDSKPDAKPETKAETKPDAKAESKPADTKAKTGTKPAPEPKASTTAKSSSSKRKKPRTKA